MSHAIQGGIMLQDSDGIYQGSGPGLTVTTRALPGNDRHAYVCLTGEIDRDSSAVLSETVAWLTALAPVSVLMDLAALTFACSALPNFVVRVRQAVPDGAEVVLWGATPATEWVLRATDMATIATIRNHSRTG